MTKPAMSCQLLVRLTPELLARLDREACLQGHSKPDIARVLIEQGLDRQDTHRMQEAMSRG